MTVEYTRVSVDNKKYAIVIGSDGSLKALRHGEPWQDLTGNKLIYCLAAELDEARKTIAASKAPAHPQLWRDGGPKTLDPNKIQLCRVGVHSTDAQAMGQKCDCPPGTCRMRNGGLKPAAQAPAPAPEPVAEVGVRAGNGREIVWTQTFYFQAPAPVAGWDRDAAIKQIADERIALLQAKYASGLTAEQETRFETLNADMNALCPRVTPAMLQGVQAELAALQSPAVQAGNWYDLRPPMLVLGRTYKTNSGKEVRMVSISNAGTEHETMADEDGHHRYSRSHGRIIGRCTGSPNDDPLNIPFDPPPTSQPPVQGSQS